MSKTDLTHLISDEMKHNLIVYLITKLGGEVTVDSLELDRIDNKTLQMTSKRDGTANITLRVVNETTPH